MDDALAPLAEYDIDPETGFMPRWEPLERFGPGFEPWDELAPLVGHLIRNRRIRERLRAMPVLDVARLATRPEQERAITLLCVYANAYVWGGTPPGLDLPASVAVPLCALCDHLGRQPIVHYAGMQLYNWRRIDRSRPLSADNAELLVQFLGGVDETWFYVANFDLELLAGPVVVAAHAAVAAAARQDAGELARRLADIAARLPAINAALDRQREWTDPHVFFHRIRPYVQGWPAPGVVYQGVSAQPRQLIGGSAGQSAVMQSLDAVLGVEHDRPQTGAYLRLLRGYMPPAHRRFVDDCERLSRVRRFVAQAGDAVLRDAYNAALEGITQFRTLHVRLAHDYIAKPSGLNPDTKGTGGTSFVEFLRDTRRETIDSRVAPAGPGPSAA
jgi:indoleamine 2,3-dioxygenase